MTKNTCDKLLTAQKDTAPMIGSYLAITDINHTMSSCKTAHAIFKNALLPTLLQAVVYGEYEKVKTILKHNPELLLLKGSVKDYAGRLHIGKTAFQLALGAGDYDVKDKNDNIIVNGMVEMIAEYFALLPGKTQNQINNIMQFQFNDQFPEGITYDLEKEKHDTKAILEFTQALKQATKEECAATLNLEKKIKKIIHPEATPNELGYFINDILKASTPDQFNFAFQTLVNYLIQHKIVNRDFNTHLLKAMYHFKNYLEPKVPHHLNLHFNYLLLLGAAHLNASTELTSYSAKLIATHLLSYLGKFVPACDAQIFSQGLEKTLEKGELGNRSLLVHIYNYSYYSFDSEPSLGCACCKCDDRARKHGLDLLTRYLDNKLAKAETFRMVLFNTEKYIPHLK